MDGNNINHQQSFFDLSNLNSLREEALQGDPDKKALKQVAAQFESIFTQMLFKSMRKANEAFEDEDSPFNASSVKFYRDMHDQQLSMELSQSGALGLADIIVEQLSPTPGKYTPASLFSPGLIPPMVSKPTEPVEEIKETVAASNDLNVIESEQSFVSELWQHAKQAAEKIGLSPAVMLAQSALETGWGKHIITKSDGQSSNNFFNIKADKSWLGDKAAKASLEFEDGVAVKKQSNFRAYNNIAESFDDFVNFLQQNPRYKSALKTTANPTEYLNELQKAGYATDPNYAQKIINVLSRSEFNDAIKSVASGINVKDMMKSSITGLGGSD
jgi:flagellar protein FlgJ